MDLLSAIPTPVLHVGLSLFSAFPLAFLFGLIPPKYHAARHLFSIIVATLNYCLLFSIWDFIRLLVIVVLVYSAAFLFPTSRHMPVFSFLLAMGFLSYSHFKSAAFEEDNVRFNETTPMMVVVIKLTSFAWSVYDGTQDVALLSEEQKQARVQTMPSFLEFLGYIYFFPGFLVGPALEFIDYQKFIYQLSPFNKIGPKLKAVMRCTAASFLCLFVFIRFSEVYTYDHSISEEFLKTHNFFQRLFYIFIVGFVNRCKFHSAWKLSEGIYNYVGVGYMGITSSGKHAWNRMQNVNIHRVEWPENPRMVSVNWNIYTQKWLRNHVYLRFSNGRGDDSGWITLITFITSAFWHGFHPGYYVSFGILGFSVVAARLIRRYVRPLFIDTWLSTFKVVYDVAGVFATMLVVNFAQIPFQMLVIEKVLKSWASLYYLLPVFLGIILIGFQWLNWGLVLRRYHRSHSFNPVASSNPKLD